MAFRSSRQPNGLDDEIVPARRSLLGIVRSHTLRVVPLDVVLCMLTITSFGAAGEVTGSSYLLETESASVLIDFGMFQGDKDDDARNVVPGPVHRRLPDAVLLTHAHLDHSGRLPLLSMEGYGGPIFSTMASKGMAELILKDSAVMQERDFERHQRKAARLGRTVARTDFPLYTTVDVEKTLELFRTVEYGAATEVAEGVSVVFREAGHMLGSASLELRVATMGTVKTVVFSGDIGPLRFPYLKDPDPPAHADIVVLESTYGDRDHKPLDATLTEFAELITEAVRTGRRIFVPSFAIGRTQQIIYFYAMLLREGRVPEIPIYIDSPMAIKATNMYNEFANLYDDESAALERDGHAPLRLDHVSYLETADESKALATTAGPYMVIAGSGMANGGRILHHLRNNIDDATADILFVGFQSHGSLGRRLVDGATEVFIMGERRTVKAIVHTLGGMSAHAGQSDLVGWVDGMIPTKPQIVLTHGEDAARTALAGVLATRFGVTPILPTYGQCLMF